ncbi:MAG TPA: alpha-2-macroglobulin [Roseiarcus sp.]|nr:alpha-2-macroglobulin [Roseiarcus sp.]
MRLWLSSLLIIVFGAFAAGAQAAEIKPFARDYLASDAVRLVETLRKEAGGAGQGKSAEQLRRDASAAAARGDYKLAARLAAAAVTVNPKDAANWLALARLAVAADDAQWSNRWSLRDEGATAAYAAYERLATPPLQAEALALLGNLMARREMWRPALDAYRASLDRRDDADTQAIYEDMREKHGFRITDYKVDNDSAAPRVCFQFSDPLARKTDFAPYVAVSGATTGAISTEEQQLCVEGLKHGERYAIVIRQGLPSSVGESLLKDADYEIYVRDRSPQVHFSGKSYVLPRIGQQGAPLVTVNTAKVAINVFRIGDRNLLAATQRDDFLKEIPTYRAKEIADSDGKKVWSGAMDVASELNKEVVTDFPIFQAVGKLEPGLYIVTAQPWKGASDAASGSDDSSGNLATQWLVVSDLGLATFSGDDGLHAVVRSLATAAPLAGVEVKLVARNNEVLATKTTDAEGRADFDPGLTRGAGGSAPSLIVASTADGDYNFLSLLQNAFDLTDRGVAGRDAPKALDAFVFTERGVYRSGETVFITALLRDAKGAAISGLPLTLVAERPDGVEYKRVVLADQGQGGRAYALPLLPGAAAGAWRIEVYADPKGPSIGETSFLLEDYVPERLDVQLKPARAILAPGEPAEIGVDAKFLYGAPGAGLDVTGSVTLQAVDGAALAGYPGYAAGLADDEFDAVTNQLDAKVQTDAKGHADVSIDLPEGTAAKPLEAKFVLRVAEPGGRAVERVVTLPLRAKSTLIGVKKDFDASLGEGQPALFDAIAVAPDGSRVARKGVEWSLYKLDNDYEWYNSEGHWSYEPVKSSRRIAQGTIDIGADAPAKISANVSWGRHRLDIKSPDGDQTSITFDVGWGGTASADTPDNAIVTLDKASYSAGEEAKLRIASHYAGKASVLVIGDKVDRLIETDLKEGDNVVPFKVEADWGPGAYAVAITHRPLDVAAKRMPGRALGLAWFSIDAAQRKLNLSIDAPEKTRPREKLDLAVKIDGLAPGEEAEATVAAVDLGILNLTHYKTPDPADFFFGQRKLPLEIRDLYGLLIDGMQGAAGAIRSGGDGGAALEGNLPTQEPVALFSGVVRAGADGIAHVSFDMPAFNGSVRVMVAAWSKAKVGSAEATVIVRDPVVATGTLPRFLALGDHSQLHVDLDNVEGDAGDYRLDLDIHGPITAPADALTKTIQLAAHQRTAINVPLTAVGVGTASIDLDLVGPKLEAKQHFALGVESGAPDLYRRAIRMLAGGASQTISSDLLADFVPGTGAVSVAVSPFGALDAPAVLQALDRYPYGCSEQLVSRAMPLLYYNRLASIENLGIDPDVDKRIKDTIDRVMARQDSNGAFGLWQAGAADDDMWLDAFVSDFLTRARERGFDVPKQGFDQALERLRNEVANTADPSAESGQPLAYALYVLARNGRPVIGDLRYLADTKLDAFKTPLATAQIAAALAMLGDRTRAGKVFAASLQSLRDERDDGYSRPDYGSKLRDGAGALALLAEANLKGGEVADDALVKVSEVVEQARAQRTYTSTQENTWMVLAAEALADRAPAHQFVVDGQTKTGSVYRKWKGFALDAKPSTIVNSSQSPAQIVITTSGVPVVPEPAASSGYDIERTFYKLDGSKFDASRVTQNDRFVVVLKVTEAEAKYARLLVVDRLPAGLEIDNPNLVDGGDVEAFSWLKKDADPAHTEYRDDRFVAALDRNTDQSAFFNLAYVVRAVAPGKYVYPPATAEDMYRPERFGRTAFSTIEVVAK